MMTTSFRVCSACANLVSFPRSPTLVKASCDTSLSIPCCRGYLNVRSGPNFYLPRPVLSMGSTTWRQSNALHSTRSSTTPLRSCKTNNHSWSLSALPDGQVLRINAIRHLFNQRDRAYSHKRIALTVQESPLQHSGINDRLAIVPS
jgi:hypothetical protein